jgi:hypothetical protein
MIVFASGAILYNTSNLIHRYKPGQHVAAALSLFASVALLFWYVLRILMSLRRLTCPEAPKKNGGGKHNSGINRRTNHSPPAPQAEIWKGSVCGYFSRATSANHHPVCLTIQPSARCPPKKKLSKSRSGYRCLYLV